MVFYIRYYDEHFPEVLREALRHADELVLYFLDTVDMLSEHRDLFLQHAHVALGKWSGMDGMFRYLYNLQDEARKDEFARFVLSPAHSHGGCPLWQFALLKEKRLILWFQDFGEALVADDVANANLAPRFENNVLLENNILW
jgi:hypothetical protein